MKLRLVALVAVLSTIVILASAGYVLMAPITVRGTITDALSGEPLAGAIISAGETTARSDAQGRYSFSIARSTTTLLARLDGYHTMPAMIETRSIQERAVSIEVALPPVVVGGVVSDAFAQEPLAGATVTLDGQSVVTDADGAFRFQRVHSGSILSVRADGFLEQAGAVSGENILPIALQPNIVNVAVVDEPGNPIVDAMVISGEQTAAAEGHGQFLLRGIKDQAIISARADGYLPATASYAGASLLTITLAANTVTGEVRDQISGQALSGVTITLQHSASQSTVSNDTGSFQLRAVRTGAIVSAGDAEHATSVITYTGQPTLALALRPDTLRGTVRDRYSAQPMPGVTVTLQQAGAVATAVSDAKGAFLFRRVTPGAIVSATAAAHATAGITYTGQLTAELSLRPNTLRGIVRDRAAGRVIAGADVSVGAVTTKTSPSGEYELAGIPEGAPLVIKAEGFDRQRLVIGPMTTLDVNIQSFAVRAIYIPFYLLTVPERVRALIDFADRSGMNAIVVDIKGDDGYLAYQSKIPLAMQIKAPYAGEMMGIDEVLKLAKERDMYTIARMVVFKDNVLAEARPDLAVTDKRSGQIWDDCGNGTTYWADPFRKDVVEYNASIAEEAGRLGFDEIQLDYIRFPPACISTVRFANAGYAVTSTMETRLAAIDTFLAETSKRLKPMGVALSVDTFGWTLMRDDDMAIGQRIVDMAKYVDFISPMVYPSTWEQGALGLDYAPAHPYDIVYKSIAFAQNRLKDIPGVKIRPWLQDFDDYQVRELSYGLNELTAQRQGAADAGAVGWMLWNAGGVYSEETP